MPSGKVKAVFLWILTVIVSLVYILVGFPKLMGSPLLTERFVELGYDYKFMRIIGLIEVAGGLLLLVPKAAFYGAAMLIVLMIGAVYTHINVGEYVQLIFPIVLLIPLAFLARSRWRTRWR